MDVILNHCGSAHWWMKDLPDPGLDQPRRDASSAPRTGARRSGTRTPRARTKRPSPTAGSSPGDAGPQPAPSAARDLPDPEHDLVGRNRRPLGPARRHAALLRPRLPRPVARSRARGVSRRSRSSARSGASIPRSSRAGSRARRPAGAAAAATAVAHGFPAAARASCGASPSPRAARPGCCASTRRSRTISSTRTRTGSWSFADNHDMSRIHTQLGASLDALEDGDGVLRDRARHAAVHLGLGDPDGEPRHRGARRDPPGFPRRLGGRRGGRDAGRGPPAATRAKRRTTCAASSPGAGPRAPCTAGRSRSSRRRTATYVYFRRDSRQLVMVAFNKTDAERRLDPGALRARSIGQNTHGARRARPAATSRLSSGIVLPAAERDDPRTLRRAARCRPA